VVTINLPAHWLSICAACSYKASPRVGERNPVERIRENHRHRFDKS
jgi:hypothetical protein